MRRCHCACHEHPGTYYAEPCSVCGHYNSRGRSFGWGGRNGWEEDPCFPILGAGYRIPWAVAERAYAKYSGKHYQSLERLAERGGFSEGEMDALLPGWRSINEVRATPNLNR